MAEINDLLFDSSSEDEDRQFIVRRRKVYRERINFDYISVNEFKERFRLSPGKLESLCEVIGNELFHYSKGGALTARQQLCIALHWFGSGGQYHFVGDAHGVSKATVCRCIRNVVTVVNRTMFDTEISWPNNVGEVINGFYNMANFPHVMGVVDGILIPIDAPTENEAAFVDRHGDHSINCMFVCGPTCQIYYLSARWPGSVHDARVLRNSSLHARLENEELFPNAVLLGDSGYPLKRWLMVPCNENPDDPGERRYNRRLKATRQTIERCLGILKEKFPCLNHMRLQPTFAAEVVKCCATLCNFARKDEEQEINIVEELGEGDEIEEENNVQPQPQEPDTPLGVQRQREIINSMR